MGKIGFTIPTLTNPDGNVKLNVTMLSLQEIRDILRKNKRLLRKNFKVKTIAIFGSTARGKADVESDVDILVDFSQPIGWEIVELKEFLEKLLGTKVDLLTYKGVLAKPSLWEAIKKDLIYV